MTNEKMLERVNEIALHLGPADAKAFKYFVERGVRSAPDVAGQLAALVLDLRSDILQDAVKASGRSSALSAAKRLLKSAGQQPQECCHGVWKQNRWQCLCDGFHAVALENEIPGLSQIPEGGETLDMVKIVNTYSANHGPTLELPTVAELKAHIKTQKAENKANGVKGPAKYDFGLGLPLVNAEYLLDMIELLPGCKAVCGQDKPELLGIYFSAEGQGEGVLFPIRKNRK